MLDLIDGRVFDVVLNIYQFFLFDKYDDDGIQEFGSMSNFCSSLL